MSEPVRVLVVDDDRAVRKALQVNLGKSGMIVTLVDSVGEALVALHEWSADLVLTDVKMPDGSGLELLAQIRKSWPELPVVMMTGYGSVEDAVSAMRLGAADYLIKPISKDELLVVLERALERRSLRAKVVALRKEVDARYGFENLIGATPAMLALYEEVASVADTSATVLIEGPTGTGKELLAHAIHYRSGRASGPFIGVNCAAIPEALLESELFGHEKGSFTGAIRQHLGKFEQADGGTILLDEIGDMNLYTQAKLLRVLQSGEIQRVGATGARRIDVRVIAATNKDLAAEVRERRFRDDLYWRLNVVRLQIPALRERRDDIPLLVEFFLNRYAEKNRRPVPRVPRKAMERLMAYDWPGNVRQLEHLIERVVILNKGEEIDDLRIPSDSEVPVSEERGILPPIGTTLQHWLLSLEREVIVAALKEAGGVQARAARRLGLSRSNLNYRISRLGITLRDVDYD